MKRFISALLALGLPAIAAGLVLLRPETIDPARLSALAGDIAQGEQVFRAGGCASCHMAEGSTSERDLPGGRRFATPFGTFVAPNISSDPTHGIGSWTLEQFASALLLGTTPDGSHYYPAFPYASYARMTDQEVADLWNFMQGLPSASRIGEPHDLRFPFNFRIAVGLWKFLFLKHDWVLQNADDPVLARGRHLVEALGHCGECHTPRNALGGLDTSRWLAGAPNPAGKGSIPGINMAKLDWSAEDIAYYLETGFTPDFDSAGGAMVEVITNISKLPAGDRAAIAAYLKAIPAVE